MVFVCLVLGYTGFLAVRNLSAFHVIFAVTIVAICRRELYPSLRHAITLTRDHWKSYRANASRTILMLTWIMLGTLFIVGITALFSVPLNYDSHCYRITRIGYWLQVESIKHFAGFDSRQNYAMFNGDLCMLWVTAPFKLGYPGVNFVQFIAGVTLLWVVWVLAIQLQLSCHARLAAVWMLLGMPVFFAQMMTSQNDIIAAAFIGAGIVFAIAGIKNNKFVLLSWLGIALALGTKGTLFYWGPGLLGMGVLWLCFYRPPRIYYIRQVFAGSLCLLIFAAPRFIENYVNYKNPFAAEEDLHIAHGEAGTSMAKTFANAVSLSAQFTAPNSNPFFLEPLLKPVTAAFITFIPEEMDQQGTMHGSSRRSHLERMNESSDKKSVPDLGSLGMGCVILSFTAICLTFLRVIKKRQIEQSFLLLSLTGSTLIFFIMLCTFFEWSPYTLRYFVLIAPILAVVSSIWIDKLAISKVEDIAITVVFLYSFSVNADVYFNGFNSGFENLVFRDKTRTHTVFRAQQQMILALIPDGSRVAVSLPYNPLHSGLFRHGKKLHYDFYQPEALNAWVSAEAFLGDQGCHALIAQTNSFSKRAGNVFAKAYAYAGDPLSEHSFICYLNRELPAKGFMTGMESSYYPASKTLFYEFYIENHHDNSLKISLVNRSNIDYPIALFRGDLANTGLVKGNSTIALVFPTTKNSNYVLKISPIGAEAVEDIDFTFPGIEELLFLH